MKGIRSVDSPLKGVGIRISSVRKDCQFRIVGRGVCRSTIRAKFVGKAIGSNMISFFISNDETIAIVEEARWFNVRAILRFFRPEEGDERIVICLPSLRFELKRSQSSHVSGSSVAVRVLWNYTPLRLGA